MSRPEYLKNGDSVAVVATAKKVDPQQIAGALKLIESWGVNVVVGKHLYASDNLYAGTDQQRLEDLQWALDSPDVKAVVFARGGYGTARIIDNVDWSSFQKRPKWLCGFSDLSVLHSHVHQNFNIETLHSTMPIFFKDGEANPGSESLKSALFGNHEQIQWGSNAMNRIGKVKAPIVGGNLSVLYSIMGTPSAMNLGGKILFLEDLTEYLYHLDRMMIQLKRSGQLDRLKGLVIGQFSDMMENDTPFGKSAYEIISEAVENYSYPVAYGAQIGHVPINIAVFHGRQTTLSVEDNQVSLAF